MLAGLAGDGGLYLPAQLPHFSPAEIAGFAGLSYVELAERVIAPFTEGALTPAELRGILEASYAGFRHKAVAPLVQLGRGQFALELFHGPTLAFKDFALQFLGNLLGHILARRKTPIVIVGATSGDTGSAAIAGCAGREHISMFILHPRGRVSDVQRRQMTTVLGANVHNIALEGTFDDCQDIVKALFADSAFRQEHALVAVNSINWARILAQVVYYFYAACALGAPARAVTFSVPTGNFGDVYAGYIAKRMGLPVEHFIVATNRNDILARCLETGAYAMQGVQPSLSPSMDIQVSSNFERLLFDLHGRNGVQVAEMMRHFRQEGSITFSPQVMAALRAEFSAHAVDDAHTTATIATIYKDTGYLLDPHTAVGVAAALAHQGPAHVPVVTLATAHPAKFPEAVANATGIHPALPAHMQGLFDLPERVDTLENKLDTIKAYIKDRA